MAQTSVKPMSKLNPKDPNTMIFMAVIAVAVIVAAAAIVVSLSDNTISSADVNYTELPAERLADGGFVIGNPEAPITIVEFADFLCPHCQQYKSEINRVMEELVAPGLARFEFRMLPTQGPLSESLFNLAVCIDDTDTHTFWDAHDTIFAVASNPSIASSAVAREVAARLGLSYAPLLECVGDLQNSQSGQFITDSRLASTTDVQGTPAVRVRYGDSSLQFLEPYTRGGAPFSAIRDAVNLANGL